MNLQSDEQETNRRENARELARMVGSQEAFAERIERSPGQVGHIIGKTPKRNIGKRLARHIERVFGKPVYWLDQSPSTRSAEYRDGVRESAADEFRALLAKTPPEEGLLVYQIIAEKYSPAQAMTIAKIFLARAEEGVLKNQ